MVKLRVVDETSSGERETAGELILASPVVTLREVIAERVRQEVESYGLGTSPGFARGAAPKRAVEAGETERLLNPERSAATIPVDVDTQIRRALRSFESNGFLVLAGERQLTDLDEAIDLRELDEIRFLRLVPLIGG
jgi:hypothetical protein